MRDRDIICLSTHYWDERRYRKQEFMSRFAASNRVLFVEPSFSMARLPELHRREVATNRLLLARMEAREQGLHVLKLPRGLPKWTDARIERINYKRFGRLIANAAQQLGFREAVLWVYNPSYATCLGSIPHHELVFDLVDDLAAYHGVNHARSTAVEDNVAEVVGRSDLLIVTASTLLDRYEPVAKRVVQVSNGFDSTRFSHHLVGASPPPLLADVPGPILGFVGTIFTLLDFPLLSEVARFHHDKSVVLVGPVEAGATEALAALRTRPNVFHIGSQPQASIPSYVAAFDVCLNAFKTGPVADSVSPLKVYEYLAMGRPVVSMPMRSLESEDLAGVVAFARDADEFCQQINWCLGPHEQAATQARIDAVAPYAWDRLFTVLDAACDVALEL